VQGDRGQQAARWKLVDRGAGAVNAAINWRFCIGERVKIRLINEMNWHHHHITAALRSAPRQA
jgi:hypothetical protein